MTLKKKPGLSPVFFTAVEDSSLRFQRLAQTRRLLPGLQRCSRVVALLCQLGQR